MRFSNGGRISKVSGAVVGVGSGVSTAGRVLVGVVVAGSLVVTLGTDDVVDVVCGSGGVVVVASTVVVGDGCSRVVSVVAGKTVTGG